MSIIFQPLECLFLNCIYLYISKCNLWRSKQNQLHFQKAHTNQITIYCFWKMKLTPLAYPFLFTIFPNLDLSINYIKIKIKEVKLNIFTTSGSIIVSKLNLCIQYKTSRWATMLVKNIVNILQFFKASFYVQIMAIACEEKVIFKKLNIGKSTLCTF